MKDILFIREASHDIGGIEKQVLLIAKELASRKLFNPILATSSRISEVGQRFEKLGFPVYEIPIGKGNRIGKGAEAIESILKEHNVALIQSHMFRESIVGRKVRKKYPKIPHVFRAHTYIDCSWIPKWKKVAYHLLDKSTSKYVDQYVCISQNAFSEISKNSWIPVSKIRLLTNAAEKIGVPDQLEDNLNLSLPARIAMVSNFLPHKGHDVLVNALLLLKQRGLRVYVRLIGGELTGNGKTKNCTPFIDSIKQDALKGGVLDQIEFYGYTQGVYEALKGFSVVILPSDSEGIPNCILEALSLRKLAIASHVGGISEIIQSGVDGFLHPPQDPDALADILEKVFTLPASTWEPVRDSGYKTWKEKFSLEQLANGLIMIYRELGVLS